MDPPELVLRIRSFMEQRFRVWERRLIRIEEAQVGFFRSVRVIQLTNLHHDVTGDLRFLLTQDIDLVLANTTMFLRE